MTVFEIVVHRNVGYKLDTIIDMMSLVDQSQGHICNYQYYILLNRLFETHASS